MVSSICIDELYIYWTDEDSKRLFRIFRNGTQLLSITSTTDTSSYILSISPGQQPLPIVIGKKWKELNMIYIPSVKSFLKGAPLQTSPC